MNQHELILLSPYRFPGQHILTLADEDMAAWLNGYTALWHPALLQGAKGPPRCVSQYEHENPLPNCVYVLPETPPLYLPDDWLERVRNAGSLAFTATPDRAATLANLRSALAKEQPDQAGDLADFYGLGWGFLLYTTLVEAMEHENLLDAEAFWSEVQLASRAAEPIEHLRQAAQKLLAAREVVYPVSIHLLDLFLMDDKHLPERWPAALTLGNPINIVASGMQIEQLAAESPNKLALLRERIAAEQAEVCGGLYREREDALLPVDSQLWNLRQGQEIAKKLLGAEVRVFARRRFGYHPQLPVLLTSSGITHSLLLCFDESSGLPVYQGVTISWLSPDGKTVDAFVRNPNPADSVNTFFNLANSWFRTIREDHTAVLALVHKDKPAAPWYDDLLHLAALAPVLGKWTTFSRFFGEAAAGEQVAALGPDEFHFDYLTERTDAHCAGVVSNFARHLRLRRRLDTCSTLAAMHRGLAGAADILDVADQLQQIENRIEEDAPDVAPPTLPSPAPGEGKGGGEFEALEQQVANVLSESLLSRATGNQPGYMVLNPCGFARRLALELDGVVKREGPEHTSPVKALQIENNRSLAVVEVPALGFAWIPRDGSEPTHQPSAPNRLRLADAQSMTMRNEFFEVEIDQQTGGLKAIRDHKSRVNRLGQRLVYNPGSEMLIRDVKVTSTGPALGEIVTEGTIVDQERKLLSNFRQRFRVWLGRPVLEMRIELEPTHLPSGYPWLSYYGSRFAWRDERGILLRGVAGTGYVSSHPRPQSPDYLELRLGGTGTVIFPGGLPFHQRRDGRMVDVILMPEGEQARTFDLAIALDREEPMQTAQGLTTPLVVVPTTKGPPHIGSSGWLFHLDSPHLLLSRLSADRKPTDGCPWALTAHFIECGGHSGQAEFRCVRDPARARVLNARGDFLLDANISGDAVHLEITPNDLMQVEVEF